MQVVFLSSSSGRIRQWTAGRIGMCLAAGVLAFGGLAFVGGFKAAESLDDRNSEMQLARWQAELDEQEMQLDATRESLQQNLDALALRLGQMNAHVVRLDALGSRLTQMAELADGEFDFESPPPLGGPEELLPGANALDSLVDRLDQLDIQIENRNLQLEVLEDLLLDRKLADEVHPEGRPVRSGYVSSGFGERSDPFSGRAAFHKGIDFAGREGNDIVAVATGVVTWAGDRYGYGEMVEVNHGSGYVTRYAHNAENLVKVGDTVRRGDVIARMGETGRATGPNLHFEVLRNGQAVDPRTFIN